MCETAEARLLATLDAAEKAGTSMLSILEWQQECQWLRAQCEQSDTKCDERDKRIAELERLVAALKVVIICDNARKTDWRKRQQAREIANELSPDIWRLNTQYIEQLLALARGEETT